MGNNLEKMIHKAQDTAAIKGLRDTADRLHESWRVCKFAHAAGTTAGLMGGVLTIGGGIATTLKAKPATPLLLIGMSFGVAGAGTNLTMSLIKSSISSNEITKAEETSKQNLLHVSDMDNTYQLWFDRKEGARLLYIGCLGVQTLEVNVSAMKLLTFIPALSLPVPVVEVIRKIASEVERAGGATGAQRPTRRARALGAKRATVQGTGDVAKVAATEGGKLAGRLIIGVSLLFLVWDTIDLYFTVTDIVENKGSDAAKTLRQKADELDK